mmetsp:Transcript_12325/g.22000  ORF Transcript_12325/g.22000 Transcript_12325/m.22000 type:complete len:113 (+) Transcript_12325:108-446(+)
MSVSVGRILLRGRSGACPRRMPAARLLSSARSSIKAESAAGGMQLLQTSPANDTRVSRDLLETAESSSEALNVPSSAIPVDRRGEFFYDLCPTELAQIAKRLEDSDAGNFSL